MSESYTPAPEILPVHEDDLAEALFEAGIASQRLQMKDNPIFPEVIILEHLVKPTERLVRVYRGIGTPDNTALQQSSYALRTLDEHRNVTVIESVRGAVEALAHTPTMKNVYTYIDAVVPHLQPRERESLFQELDEIERSVLSGLTVRRKLINLQSQRGGVVADYGLAPYVSSTFDSDLAAAYSRGGVLVMDIPLSEIDGYSAAGEVNIKVGIDPKYISAIIKLNTLERRICETDAEMERQLQLTLEAVNVATGGPMYTEDELVEVYELKLALERANDQVRHNEDVDVIQTKIAEKIADTFPEVGISFLEAQEMAKQEQVSVFEYISKRIFTVYEDRLLKVCRNGRTVENFSYAETEGYSTKERGIDRNNITRATLEGLRKHALFWEKRAEEEYDDKRFG